MPQTVEMWYLRDGPEFLKSKAKRTPLSLRDPSHRTTHSLSGEPIGLLPVVESFDTLEDFFGSPPPPVRSSEYKLHAVYEEPKFWCVPAEEPVYNVAVVPVLDEKGEPRHDPYSHQPMLMEMFDTAHGLPIPKKHEDAIAFYGTAHRINAVSKAQDDPVKHDPYRHPMNWAAAFVIAICGVAIAFLAVQLGLAMDIRL